MAYTLSMVISPGRANILTPGLKMKGIQESNVITAQNNPAVTECVYSKIVKGS